MAMVWKESHFCFEPAEVSVVSVSQVPESCRGVKCRQEEGCKYFCSALCKNVSIIVDQIFNNIKSMTHLVHIIWTRIPRLPTACFSEVSWCCMSCFIAFVAAAGAELIAAHWNQSTHAHHANTVWAKCLVLAHLSLATCCNRQTIKYIILLQCNPLGLSGRFVSVNDSQQSRRLNE